MKTAEKQDKKAYFAGLRARWQSVKNELTQGQIDEITCVIKLHGLNISPYSYAFCAMQMRSLGFDGIPYADCKTYKGWQQFGFQVRKGEHSEIDGITWIAVGKDSENNDERYMLPKLYHLFHRSQVEPIEVL